MLPAMDPSICAGMAATFPSLERVAKRCHLYACYMPVSSTRGTKKCAEARTFGMDAQLQVEMQDSRAIDLGRGAQSRGC